MKELNSRFLETKIINTTQLVKQVNTFSFFLSPQLCYYHWKRSSELLLLSLSFSFPTATNYVNPESSSFCSNFLPLSGFRSALMASGKRENEAAANGLPDQKEQVNTAALQYQNQRLVQQLEAQKAETHALEEKFKELRNMQISYDSALISVNRIWNQLVDDLVLLGIRTGQGLNFLPNLDHEELSTHEFEACPSEEIFLLRLLKSGPVDKNLLSEPGKFAKESLNLHYSIIMDMMRNLQENISALWSRNDCLKSALDSKLAQEDAVVQLENHNDYIQQVVKNMNKAIETLHEKHRNYTDELGATSEINLREKSEIKQLRGDLEESMAELEESRRKLAILQMQRNGSSLLNNNNLNSQFPNLVNGNNLGEREMCLDNNIGNNHSNNNNTSMNWQELKEAVEEAKNLATNRLFELHEAQEDNLILSKKLEDFQEQLKDDKYVTSSKLYILLEDRLRHINVELEKYKGLFNSMQTERIQLVQIERELNAKSEFYDNLKASITNYESKIEDSEHQIKKFISEKNELEMKLEETLQDSGKKDFKEEINVMAMALTKEMEMMENQLNRYKSAASETQFLREKSDYLRNLLSQKVDEHKNLSDLCNEKEIELKSLRIMVENLEKQKLELQTILDMYNNESSSSETRKIEEMRESEERGNKQAEILKQDLEEHNLELRVKAANEAESACKLRLSIAESEIHDLRTLLDSSDRDVMELREAIRIKDAEGESYISEIETIGQAYEDMQTQNQHLIQQVADRDDYNIKLVSESVKMKQTQSSLLSEKQLLIKQFQQVNSLVDPFKSKLSRGEDQIKSYMIQAIKNSSENKHLAINLERSLSELSDAERETKWLRSFVGSTHKEFDENNKKIKGLKLELEQERNDRKKLEDELAEVKDELKELSSETEESTIKKLDDEIKECKAILKCGVCFDRPKEVVITKCFHLFCSACIQRNLEIRHRKCPGCGTPFGQNDVREVKI
ncbi:hypothetical protein LUZ60_006452 [Juncus effusus]|nr:hypothetical protein LUZ60_006452 [Juncus effusus]